jgi:hypothetical protein
MKTALRPQMVIKPRQLTVEDLKTLPISIKIQDDSVIIERSPRGWKLRQPVKLSLEKVLAVRERGLVAYIFSSFTSERPNLIPFIFNNKSLIRMARHFLATAQAHPTASTATQAPSTNTQRD